MKTIGIQLNDNSSNGILMDLKCEVIRDSENKIVQGLVVGGILEQNMALILMAHEGEFKSNPDVGVGIGDVILGSDYLEYRHKIRKHFSKDRLKIKSLDFFENKPFKIDAGYE